MLDVRLEYIGGGRFQTRSKSDFDMCNDELQQGDRVRAKVTHQRSVRQNDYFHALIEAAFENQRGGPQLPSWRHLKSWLLIQADWCDVKRFDPGAMTPAVAAALRQVFDTVDFTTDGKSILMKVARSVRFGQGGASSEDMKEIVDRVVAIICTDIVPGCSPDELMNMARAKAA